MVLVEDIFEGLWDNRAILQSMESIGKTEYDLKKRDGNFFRALRRVLYVIGNMPETNYPIKDLLCLAYADYLRTQLLESIERKDNYLTIGLKEYQGVFVEDMERVVNDFNSLKAGRLKGIDPADISADEFESIINDDLKKRINHHLKLKEMLHKYTLVEDRMKKIFAEAMVVHLSEMNNAYKTSLPSTEQRHHAIREYVKSAGFRAIARKLLEQYFFQDKYFKVFREIYMSQTYE